MRSVYLASAAGLAMLVAAGDAMAQAASDDAGEVAELVVTARKREERLFDVPTPVTAITGAQMSATRLQDARDLISIIPTGFLQEVNAGTARDINIRGVGTPNLFAEPGVSMYVDDVYSSGFISYPTQFYDLERVEVLRGPQGGLYGRNAVGGAVNVISRRPTEEFGGSVRGYYGSWRRYELEGVVNVPINEQTGLRAVAWRTDQDKGEYFNPLRGEWLDRNDSTGGRLVFNSTAIEGVELNLVVEGTTADAPGTILYFSGPVGETKKTIRRDVAPENSFDTARLAAQADWDVAGGRATLVLGYRNYALRGAEDTDLTATLVQVLRRKNSVNSTSAELRWASPDMGPVSVLLGVNYLDERARGFVFSDRPVTAATFGVPFNIQIDNDQSLESWSGFIEADWRLSDTLTLIGDLRYTHDRKYTDFAFTPTAAFTAAVPSFTPQALETTRTFKRASPGLTLAWEPDADWRAYAKVQTGFRGGGFNFNVARAANLPYDSETSINYEIGVKRRLAGGYVAATAFLLKQEDVLTSQFDLTVPGPTGSYFANTGKARTYGLELEANIEPIEGLNLNANIGLLDAEYTSGTVFFFGSLKGKQLPASRDFTAAVVANYRRPIADDTDLLLNAAYTHRSDGFADAANNTRVGSADLLNLSAGVDFRQRFEVMAFVQNLFDSDPIIAQGGFIGGVTGEIRAPGKSVGVQLRVDF